MLSTFVCAAMVFTPAAGYPRANLLVEATELKAARTKSIVLDVRAKSAYDAGHIPGAQWVDVRAWEKAFGTPEAKAWSQRLGEAGIEGTKPVVVYGGDDVRDTARIWWILKYWNYPFVGLLNGGWSAWIAADGPVSREPTVVVPINVLVTPKTRALATKEQLLTALKGSPPQLIDARSSAEYCGEAQTAKRNGMIPGAIHLEWTETIDPKTKKFKSPEELAAMIRERKIDLDKPAVTYCQSGGRAAVVAFTLELMGGKQIVNYYKSWSEWGNAEDTPVEVQKKK
jgi:thiosulfate/3-mercaptopyruvate sulfurtransferase